MKALQALGYLGMIAGLGVLLFWALDIVWEFLKRAVRR